jgi:hypothetical protein
MQFHVGPYVYSVRRRWSLTCDGEPLDGYCASSIHCIFLDGALDDAALVETLRHEHSHAWAFHVGEPRTPEDRANFTATVGGAFDGEFAAQGGLDALKALPIEGLPPTKSKPTTMNHMTITDRVECGNCGAPIMCGSIYTGAPRLSAKAGITLVARGCQCPVCDRVQVWDERATPDGLPLGEYFNVRFLVGPDADEWLREHARHCPYNVA